MIISKEFARKVNTPNFYFILNEILYLIYEKPASDLLENSIAYANVPELIISFSI